jgi:hypothetical protein
MSTTPTTAATLADLAQRLRAQSSAAFGPEGFALLAEAADKLEALASAPQVSPIPASTHDTVRLFIKGLAYLRKNKIANFPEGAIEVNGVFKRFMDTDTDSAWLGFRIAMQAARRMTMTALQPMDTAPLDGTEVVLRVKSRAGIRGKYLVGHYMPGGHCIEDHPPISAGWYFWNGSMFDEASEPEGWLALPADKPTTGESA